MKLRYVKKLQKAGPGTIAIYLPSFLKEKGWEPGNSVVIEIDTERLEVKVKKLEGKE